MKNEQDKTRKSRLKAPQYRVYVGRSLKHIRQDFGYSLNDIEYLTAIPPKTIIELEKGITTNLDYYVIYAQSLKYDFATLTEAGIQLGPLKQLPEARINETFLTKKIRNNIISKGFLDSVKTSEAILIELERLNLIDSAEIDTAKISGVLRNFVQDNSIRIVKKQNGKNYYLINDQKV